MDMGKGKGRKGLIIKICRYLGSSFKKPSGIPFVLLSNNRSPTSEEDSPDNKDKIEMMRNKVAPRGCFSVYVGPKKQQFLIKIEYANHPLFKILLEEAELEYGYNSEGPLALPCNIDFFCDVLMEIDSGVIHPARCNFTKGYGSSPLQSFSKIAID